MKEIKFRVWNGLKMEYDITVGKFGVFYVNPMAKGNGLDEKDSASLTPFNTKYPDETPTMQYTGLKDKNGKEIYEGDIVDAWSEGYRHTGEIRWRFDGQPSIIIYPAFANQGFWKLHGQGSGDAFTDNKIDDGVEIIGNIYENPNLIK